MSRGLSARESPEVLKAVCLSTTVSIEQCPFFECMAITDTTDDYRKSARNLRTISKYWRKAQKDGPSLRGIISSLQTGTRASASRTQADSSLDCRYLKDWDRAFLLKMVSCTAKR